MKKRNEYDYNKMIEDFTLRDTIAKDRKKRFKPLVELNRRYPKLVKEMKNTVKENELKKIQRFRDEYLKKSQRYEEQRELIRGEKNEKNAKEKKERLENETRVKRKHTIALEKQEEERNREGKRTEENLKRFTEMNYIHKLEKQREFEDKLKRSNEEHEKNLQERDRRYEEQIKERDEKMFQKYTKNYWARRERQQKRKEKNDKMQKHLEMVRELQEENERQRIAKQKKYMKKLNDMTKKRLELEEKKQQDYEAILETQRVKFENTKTNLKELQKDDELFRQSILDYQRALVFRGVDKDKATTMKKSNARENTILSQMEMERKIAMFNKDLNKLKDQSILKKSLEQRRQIYKDLLKAEAEKKKKEEEEKMLANK